MAYHRTLLRVSVRVALPALLGGGLLLQGRTASGALLGAGPYQGTITIGTNSFINTNVFGILSYPASGLSNGPLIDAPIALDARGNYVPDLATVVPTVANGGIMVMHGDEVMTIHLKPGQRWSDGSPITPADYIGALLLSVSPDVSISCNGPYYKSARATATVLTITFKGIYGPALDGCVPAPVPMEYLQRKYGAPLPAGLLTSFDADQAAALYAGSAYKGSALQRLIAHWLQDPYNLPADRWSGPYLQARSITDQLTVFTPNPYYAARPPDPLHSRPAKIETVVRDFTDPAFLKSLASPSIYATYDLLAFFDPIDLPVLRRSRYTEVLSFPDSIEHLELNQANPALADARVRQALAYGLDMHAYLAAVYPALTNAEAAATLQSAPVPSVSPWSIDAGKGAKNRYDLARARTLLAAAGYANSPTSPGKHLRFSFYTTEAPYRVRSALALQEQWARMGVTLTLHYAPQSGQSGLFSSYTEGGILARRRFDIAEFTVLMTAEPTNLLFYLDPGQIPDQDHPDGTNYGGVRDVTLLDLLVRAEHSADAGARRRLYVAAQRRIIDNAYWISLFDPPEILLVKPTIGNFNVAYSPGGNYGWNAYQWYRSGTH